MRFIVDECTGDVVATWLASQGHDVVSVISTLRGLDDLSILAHATSEERILISNDKDFGDYVFRDRLPHSGIILLRLSDDRPDSRIHAITGLLRAHGPSLEGRFVVLSEDNVRFATLP